MKWVNGIRILSAAALLAAALLGPPAAFAADPAATEPAATEPAATRVDGATPAGAQTGAGESPGEPGAAARRPRLGLVLSGGGALGFAHIGVIRVLEELGVPVDFVAGTSMGSIIGGLYATGYTAEEMVEVQAQLRWDELFLGGPRRSSAPYQRERDAYQFLFELPLGRKGLWIDPGLLGVERAEIILSLLTAHCAGIRDFDRLPIPFRAVATDLVSGSEVVFRDGSLVEAIRASMAVPGLFEPLRLDGRVLVDGGILNNLPVNVAVDAGCEYIIAVDLSREADAGRFDEPLDVLSQSIMMMIRQETRQQREQADLVISPDVSDFTAVDFHEAENLIEIGENAAREMVPQIRELLRRIGEEAGTGSGGRRPGPCCPPVPSHTVIDDVRIAGAATRDGYSLRQALKPQIGEKLDTWDVYRKTAAHFSPLRYGKVRFALQEEGDRTVLALSFEQLPPQPGTSIFRFGYALRGMVPYYEEDVSVLASLVFQDIGGPGSLWQWDLYLLDAERLDMEYFQPLGSGFFASVMLSGLYDDLNLFIDDKMAARFDVAQLNATARLGVYLRRWGQLYAGYRIGHVRSDVEIGSTSELGQLGSFEGRVAGFLGGWAIDTLDRPRYPSTGSRASLEIEAASSALGSESDFLRFEMSGRQYFSLAERHTLALQVGFGTDFDRGLEVYQWFTLGGADSLPGYRWDALSGTNYGLISAEYRYLITEDLVGRLARQGRLFAWVRAAAGNTWDSFPDHDTALRDLHLGGTIGIGIDSLIGAAALEIGVSLDGKTALYFTAGSGLW